MPEIAKINAVAIADIEKVDAIIKANIADINGLTIPSGAVTPPLDTYTDAAAAYSVRLLRTAYTGAAMRVRRDTGGTGDDHEADVAFDTSLTNPTISLDSAISNASAGVTATTLGQFLNVGTVGGTTYTNPDSLTVTASCFVNEWMDQSGNANDAEQTAQGSQPQIHNGTVNTDLITENGKPAVDFDGDSIFVEHTPSSINLGTNDHYVSGVVTVGTNADSNQVWLEEEGGNSARYVFWWLNSNQTLQLYANSVIGSGTSSVKGDQYLLTGTRVGTTSTLFKNGVSSLTGTAADFDSTGDLKIGINQSNLGNQSWDGVIQEIVVWPSNESEDRTGIENNVNAYFGIF